MAGSIGEIQVRHDMHQRQKRAAATMVDEPNNTGLSGESVRRAYMSRTEGGVSMKRNSLTSTMEESTSSNTTRRRMTTTHDDRNMKVWPRRGPSGLTASDATARK